MPKWLPSSETSIGANATSVSSTFLVNQAISNYATMAVLQNQVDAFPQFQSVVTTAQSTTADTVSWNAPTESANYVLAQMLQGVSRVSVGSGATSATISLPSNFGTTGYGIIVAFSNTVDAFPQFQPILITSKANQSAVASWNAPTESANYVLNCYAISLTT